ncbi:MAG: cytidylate kinase family protein, partial [Candidatus Taylorbacteria bacterium]|nr:cytidylate kinase family protein [Candidatus Taylorbacteria bacterium]
NITISGPIGSGTTTLGRALAEKLRWKFVEGGEVFANMHKDLGLGEEEVAKRPDERDIEFDKKMQTMLSQQEHQVIESHLAGFNAKEISGVFKIRLVCEENGADRQDIRIARIAKRDGLSFAQAEKKHLERQKGNIEKYRRVYGINPYIDSSLYDVTINTFDNDEQAVVQKALDAIGLST